MRDLILKKIYITNFDIDKYDPKEIFSLTKPFLNTNTGEWKINNENQAFKDFADFKLELTLSANEADLIFISEPLNHNQDSQKYKKLADINKICQKRNIMAHAFISGDYGKVHPKFSNVIYYRMGGFKTQLDKNNKAFFFLLSDQLKKLFGRDEIFLRKKKEKPTVGFCGHASYSIPKLFYEKLKLAQINLKRVSVSDFVFEPLFASAYERLKILKRVSRSKNINTNFIFRKKYRAGAVTEQVKLKTTLEYYENIIESDYILCLRGSGNFSVRFFETLMMGRIPIFVNTDCLLPLEDEINWKNQVVWVEWKDKKRIAEIILDFHKNVSEENFIQMQKDNREIWKSKLNVKYYLESILRLSG